MKRMTAVFLAGMIALSAFSVQGVSLGFSEGNAAFAVADGAEKLVGGIVSVFAREYNRLFGGGEGDMQKAQPGEQSWESIPEDYALDSFETTLTAETWVMQELTFTSTLPYGDCFDDVTLDLVLTGQGRKYTVPGFWNGENTWKVRFVCPLAGVWYYATECSDKSNTGLHNRRGKVICRAYSGEHDIYKNGFVTTRYGEKYFTYDNGTPFLYLGDTHWSLGDETAAMVQTISETRRAQGFTVMQSEPIGAGFDVTDGITQKDMAGFADYDAKFQTIANNGLVHANAAFFFPGYMDALLANFGGYGDECLLAKNDKKTAMLYDLSSTAKDYLEKLTRYWVARYGAFPVLWTLGQEVDNDFYRTDDNHSLWGVENNPYKLIAQYFAAYDCYDHPLSAHQENTGATAAYGNGEGATDKRKVYCDGAAPSAFRDVQAHNWYAVQWNPKKTAQFDFAVTKDYWYNGQGKPAVNYEGAYCYLWTKNFGSRMQGWCAYLSGLYGYGWGGHDTWSYTNIYDEQNDSSDGLDVITSKEKTDATWQDSLAYESGYQCGYMLRFLKGIAWQDLIPRFDNKAYFVPCRNVYYACAGNADNSRMVLYFYSFADTTLAAKTNAGAYSGTATGTLGNLEKQQKYTYHWFNPVTGEFEEEGEFVASRFGTHYMGKKAPSDMVLLVEKAD